MKMSQNNDFGFLCLDEIANNLFWFSVNTLRACLRYICTSISA